MIEAMKQMVSELEYVLDCINKNKMPFDGDDFHEALRLGRKAIAEAEKQEREWVGLTDEETQTCWDKAVNTIAPQYSIVRAIEAKLKKKNSP